LRHGDGALDVTDGWRLLVVGAHAADFVWRAAGAIALHTRSGGNATVVALSYGERGESGDLWRVPGQTVEAVKVDRRREAEAAAAAVGADFVPFDLGDYPLRIDEAAEERLVELVVELAPQVLVTHPERDPFNPDHPVAFNAVERARKLATGAGGAPAAFATVPPPALYVFEPHQPEQCGFVPNVFLDITPVFDQKLEGMKAMASQTFLQQHYEQRAEQRAVQARYYGATAECRYAEAFQRLTPALVERL
jgi:4-oxalomesaconate hydratase